MWRVQHIVVLYFSDILVDDQYKYQNDKKEIIELVK